MHNLLEKVLFYVCRPSIIINRFLHATPTLRSVLIWKINGRVGGLFTEPASGEPRSCPEGQLGREWPALEGAS